MLRVVDEEIISQQEKGAEIPEAEKPEQKQAAEPRNHLSNPRRKRLIALGCVILLLSILGGSFIGPSSNLLTTEISWIKTNYAHALRILYCIPLVIAEVIFKKDYKLKMKSALTRRNIITLMFTPMLYCFWNFGLLFGAANMIQSHAYICNTMFSIFVVLIGYCLCLKPYRLELIGLVLTIAGVVLMLSDGKAERTDGKVATWWHYAVCISAAFGAAFFFLFNGHLVKAFPIFTLLLIQSTIGYFYILILLFISYPDDFKYFSLDPYWGGFGYFNSDEAFYALFCFGMTGGFWGSLGYVISLLFFSPVIVSASFLFEPFVGQMIGYWMDIDHFPGWLTWTGTFCVFFGVLGIQKADRQRK